MQQGEKMSLWYTPTTANKQTQNATQTTTATASSATVNTSTSRAVRRYDSTTDRPLVILPLVLEYHCTQQPTNSRSRQTAATITIATRTSIATTTTGNDQQQQHQRQRQPSRVLHHPTLEEGTSVWAPYLNAALFIVCSPYWSRAGRQEKNHFLYFFTFTVSTT